MSEPEVVRVLDRPLRCHHCGGERFYKERIRLDVSNSLPVEFLESLLVNSWRGAVLLACTRCGLGQLFFPSLVEDEPPPAEPAADDEPVPCLACGEQIPQGSSACPACNWTWSS